MYNASLLKSPGGPCNMEALEARRLFSGLVIGAAAALTPITASTAAPAAQQSSGLAVTFGAAGISELSYNGTVLFNQAVKPSDIFTVLDFNETIGGVTTHYFASPNNDYTTSWNAGAQTLTCTFAWGTVAAKYTINASSVEMAITVTNATAATTIDGLNVSPLTVCFPVQPVGFNGGPVAVGGATAPGAIVADFGTGAMAMVNEDEQLPLYCGFLNANGALTENEYSTWIGSAQLPGRTNWPSVFVPIAPRSSTTYHCGLRFGPTGSTAATLAPDVLASYAAANPYSVNWPDRRPIGMLFPSGSGPAARSATNPRGWFNDPTVNVTTPAGLAAFAQELLAYAAGSIQEMQNVGAQGMITWDIEGEQFPTVGYIGDPELATILAPELAYNNVVNQYFAMFTNAGFRVGVTLRPQAVTLTNGVPTETDITDPAVEVQTLVSRINYAQQNWGCTLFYIDSTSFSDSPTIMEQVHQQCPNVLLIPEIPNTGMYSASVPFGQVRQGSISVPASVSQVYPNAFMAIDTSAGNVGAVEPQLVNAVRNGSILLFSGWHQSRQNLLVKQIYQEAANSMPTTAPAVKGKSAATPPATTPTTPSVAAPTGGPTFSTTAIAQLLGDDAVSLTGLLATPPAAVAR